MLSFPREMNRLFDNALRSTSLPWAGGSNNTPGGVNTRGAGPA
ncbi:hypothetical protein [Microvirga arsenatis]|nr:hypothetical protein [Microvirga arsenatis]